MAAPKPGIRHVDRHLLAIVVLVATACGSSTAHASKVSPSPSASPGATVTVLPTATPAGPTDLPVTPVGFACRLPVITLTYGPESNTYQGGFVTFPAGTYQADPTGVIDFKSGFFVTQQTPALIGEPDQLTPPFFDAAAGRWVPSSAGETAPDGSSYAYANTPDPAAGAAIIHVVDVRSGTDKTYRVALPVASATGISVMDDDGSGVYFVVDQIDQLPIGVWRLDLGTGSVTAMAQVGNVMAVRDGNAWAASVDPRDPTPPQAGVGPPFRFDTIYEVNLVSHIPTSWYYTQGRSDVLLGFASGDRPIIAVSAAPSLDSTEIRLIDHPNTSGGEDNGELVSGPGLSLGNPQADGDRTWLAGDGGIYLYTQAAGLQRVFAGPGNPKNGGMISPAGLCR